MRMAFRLDMEQTQKLIMTPELRQAITVLQLSSLELSEYIEQELLENPLLELDTGDVEASVPQKEEELYDIDWQDYFDDISDLGYPRFKQQHLDMNEGRAFEQFFSREASLYDHLWWQLHLALPQGLRRDLGEFIIGNLDENGYLTCGIKEIAQLQQVSETEVWEVLQIIQGFDPPGVGAQSLEECLLIQVKVLGVEDPIINNIIRSYLTDIAQNRLAFIANKLGVTVQRVQTARDFLRTLDPKPGRQFAAVPGGNYIIPDVMVEKVGNDYVVIVNDVATPRLIISPHYRRILNLHEAGEQARVYIESKLNSARWLIKSIEQRRLTLYKIAETIVEYQRDFFDEGIRFLKPLTLRQIAQAVGVHESTVSRATSNKYIQTHRGVYPLRFFFASGVENISGTSTSSQSIKQMLKELIGQEKECAPYSDQKLADLLQKQGLMISRRTVAKYRQEMGIPPSNCRKRY
ncbi:MAG: RNA polymerase factor sigma-54 [bacterium]